MSMLINAMHTNTATNREALAVQRKALKVMSKCVKHLKAMASTAASNTSKPTKGKKGGDVLTAEQVGISSSFSCTVAGCM